MSAVYNASMIETHAHLFLCKDDTADLVARAKAAGVTHIVNVGIDAAKSQLAIDEAMQFDGVVATVGTHPCEARSHDQAEIERLAQHPQVVAIGEIGLDYYHDDSFKETQEAVLREQMVLARTIGKPVIIHTRHADEDIVRILSDYPDVPKVFHCFASSKDVAAQLDGPNTYFSFTAMVTYSKKGKVINALKWVPLEKLMIETDCPYLTPKALQGQPNEPSFLSHLVERIADVKGVPVQSVIDQTTQTAKAFFGLES